MPAVHAVPEHGRRAAGAGRAVRIGPRARLVATAAVEDVVVRVDADAVAASEQRAVGVGLAGEAAAARAADAAGRAAASRGAGRAAGAAGATAPRIAGPSRARRSSASGRSCRAAAPRAATSACARRAAASAATTSSRARGGARATCRAGASRRARRSGTSRAAGGTSAADRARHARRSARAGRSGGARRAGGTGRVAPSGSGSAIARAVDAAASRRRRDEPRERQPGSNHASSAMGICNAHHLPPASGVPRPGRRRRPVPRSAYAVPWGAGGIRRCPSGARRFVTRRAPAMAPSRIRKPVGRLSRGSRAGGLRARVAIDGDAAYRRSKHRAVAAARLEAVARDRGCSAAVADALGGDGAARANDADLTGRTRHR